MSPGEWYSTGEGVKDCTEPFSGDRPAGEGDTDAVCLAGEAVCVGRRSRCARRARRRRRTACTSGLCGAPCRYLTASPSPSPPSRPPCPPSPWRRGRATWRTGPGGRTQARGPGPCPGKSPSYKSLFYFPATHSLPFTRH